MNYTVGEYPCDLDSTLRWKFSVTVIRHIRQNLPQYLHIFTLLHIQRGRERDLSPYVHIKLRQWLFYEFDQDFKTAVLRSKKQNFVLKFLLLNDYNYPCHPYI